MSYATSRLLSPFAASYGYNHTNTADFSSWLELRWHRWTSRSFGPKNKTLVGGRD